MDWRLIFGQLVSSATFSCVDSLHLEGWFKRIINPDIHKLWSTICFWLMLWLLPVRTFFSCEILVNISTWRYFIQTRLWQVPTGNCIMEKTWHVNITCLFEFALSSHSPDQDDLFDMILTGEFEYLSPFWNDISDSVKVIVVSTNCMCVWMFSCLVSCVIEPVVME